MKTWIGIALVGIALLDLQAESVIRRSPELAFNIPGQGPKLLSQYRGKVIALEFILTTCPHCQAASKVMSGLQAEYAGKGFQALDVAVDPDADSQVANFAKNYQVAFPVGSVSLEGMMSYMNFQGRPVVPQLVLIDRNGNIRYQTPQLGDPESMKEDVIRARIQELLREPVRNTSGMQKKSQRG